MTRKKHAANYSIENIAQSIVRDNPTGKKYSQEDKRALYGEKLRMLEDFPALKELFSFEHLRNYRIPWTQRIARIGILPPQLIVVDSRIQDMCALPFWSYYGSGDGSFGRCAGIGAFSCCPPFNLKAEKVQALMDRADLFLVLQTRPSAMGSTGDPGAQFRALNTLTDEIKALLGKAAVVQKFAGGPCFACYPEVCEGEGKCGAPQLKIPSLEGMGVCVDQLCKDLAFLTGDEDWKIKWIQGFGAPEQTPKRWKSTVGLALKIQNQA
jgi:predicted metal-binding protein